MDDHRLAAMPTRFLVELRAPALGFQDVGELAGRAASAAREVTTTDAPVRFLRAVSVPEDGSCLLVFEALDAAAVEDVARRALIDFDRVTPVITLAAGLEMPREAIRSGQSQQGGST
jgi:hypothetical protein